MTITYMNRPRNKLTLGSTDLENVLVSAKVTRLENGFDSAIIILPRTSYYPSTVTEGTTVQLAVKNQSEATYTTLFVGTVRFINADIAENNNLTLTCRGIGAGLSEMLVAAEYGSQSSNGLDTITEILTDSTYGIIPNYVQKILGGSASNYAFDTTYVESITDSIPYISWPYKPANKCLNDLIDLVTAYKAGTAGPHWITTYAAGTNYLRVKLVSGTQTGWTKYYGNSQANATLTYKVDYKKLSLEKMASEANYIVYYGAWRRPSNGDVWTENNAANWGHNGNSSITDSDTYHIIGAKAAKLTTDSGNLNAWYPSSDANWDFSKFSSFATPTLNFYVYNPARGVGFNFFASIVDTNGYKMRVDLTSAIAADDVWYHFELPIGPYYKQNHTANSWTNTDVGGTFDWEHVDSIQFEDNTITSTQDWYIDGLNFGGADICRVAALSDYTGIIVKQKLITDNIGKDDSLLASDDSGLLAKLAYSELLRLRTNSTVGTIETKMIKDILPGQWLYIQGADYRITKISHTISNTGYTSTFEITSDVINGRARTRYEDINKQWEAIRPEWQDRQASNLKAGSVDFRVERLEKTYT